MTDSTMDLERREEAPKRPAKPSRGVSLTVSAFASLAMWAVIGIGFYALRMLYT